VRDSELKERGELIGDLDILVASIALANNEKLITRNIKRYNRIMGLEIESWWYLGFIKVKQYPL
jgi:tRNA(fMet)-specific endonuclease VapC